MRVAPPTCRSRPTTVWRSLQAPWTRGSGVGLTSGTTTIRAGVAPAMDRGVWVGTLEEFSGSTGPAWRSSVWVASLLASVTLGRELGSRRFLLSVGGFIDGPSAGGLIAVGFMAAMAGQRVRARTTMTGALGPDGSLLPVANVPDKIRAARRAGYRTVGIPRGQRWARDLRGERTDVVALGQSLGVRVVELGDLRAAYALLTGVRLARPRPVATSELAVPAWLTVRMRARLRHWLRVVGAGARSPQGRDAGFKPILARAAQARRHLAAGRVVAAYAAGYHAAAMVVARARFNDRRRRRKDDTPAGAEPDRLAPTRARLAQFRTRLTRAAQGHPANALGLLAAYGEAARAMGFVALAQRSYAATSPWLALLSGYDPAAVSAALAHAFADLSLEIGGDLLEAADEGQAPLTLQRRQLGQTARGLVSAAIGSLEFVDALVLVDAAKLHGLSIPRLRLMFAQRERLYLLSQELARLGLRYTLQRPDSLPSRLVRLAAAAASYVVSGVVLVKYYALSSDLSESEEKRKARQRRTLDRLLGRAARMARIAAGRAKRALGVVPPHAQLYYQLGRVLRGGDRARRLRALLHYWSSAIASRVAARVLRRGARPPARRGRLRTVLDNAASAAYPAERAIPAPASVRSGPRRRSADRRSGLPRQ